MENLKRYILKTCERLKEFLLKKWITLSVGCMLLICLKLPFKILFEQLGFMLGYYISCGVYALLIGEVLNNFKDKKFYRSRFTLLTIFIIGVLSSYIVKNYNIYQLIFS